jgi:surface antigen
MLKLVVLTILSTAAILPVSGCVATSGGDQRSTEERSIAASCPFFSQKMLTGTVAGAAVGGAAAALTRNTTPIQKVLMIVGAAAVGSTIGKHLDQSDCNQARVAMQQMAASQVGTAVTWTNPESGNHGTYVAKNEATPNSAGQLCRAYRETVVLKDGTSTDQNSITCRDANGDWHTAA